MSLNTPGLQQLLFLDKSSPGFLDQVNSVLRWEEFQQSNLTGHDLAWIVNYFDNVLDSLDASSAASRKCLRCLMKICSSNATLPTSFTVPPDLLRVSPNPFASGGHSDVYLGTLRGLKVIVKRVRVYTADGPDKVTKVFYSEAVAWKRLTHPNIVPLLGVTTTPLQLIAAWMPGGTLSEYISGHPDADRRGLLSDVATGLCYLHSFDVIHGDIKGANIHVDGTSHARIANFSLATVTKDVDSIQTTRCQVDLAPRWTAPEVLNGGAYTKAADVFSFAMLMIEVFTGRIPFSGVTPFLAVFAIMEGRRPPRPTYPAVTENLWTLIQRCWDQDPHSRPEAAEASQALIASDPPAWKRLITQPLSIDERTRLLTSTFSDRDEVEMAAYLSRDDAQAFVNVIDEVMDSLPWRIRRRCLRYLYHICGCKGLLPKSLQVSSCCNQIGAPQYCGEFADVWKGRHDGRDVAIKVLKVSVPSDSEAVRGGFCKEVVTWRALRHTNVLPLLGVEMTDARLAMVSEWMDGGNINQFSKNEPQANRLLLLQDVAQGLIYLHGQGLIHGDLKGNNIMIDKDGRACLADFGLLTLDQDQSAFTIYPTAGTLRWMSPELLDPEGFGLSSSRPTRSSDCYALGMVIYEVLTGHVPFEGHGFYPTLGKILSGERPKRPKGEGGKLWTDGIWAMVERCWRHTPGERASAEDVLRFFGGTPSPPCPDADADAGPDIDNWLDATYSGSDHLADAQRDGVHSAPDFRNVS